VAGKKYPWKMNLERSDINHLEKASINLSKEISAIFQLHR
jgi:hypothetical protein